MKRVKKQLTAYFNDSTIHGFLELTKQKKAGKIFWITMMVAVFAAGVLLLTDLIADILKDPKVTSITSTETFEEPIMVVQPIGFIYKTDHLDKMSAEMEDTVYNLTEVYLKAIKSSDQQISHCPMQNTMMSGTDPMMLNPMNDPGSVTTGSPDTSKPDRDEIIEKIKTVRSQFQRAVTMAEFTNTDEIIWPKPHIKRWGVITGHLKQFMCDTEWLKRLSSDDTVVAELIQALDITHIDDINEDVYDFYDKIVPDLVKVPQLTATHLQRNPDNQEENEINHKTQLGFSSNGVLFKFNLSVEFSKHQVAAKWYRELGNTVTSVEVKCSNPYKAQDKIQAILWGVGSEHTLRDVRPGIEMSCNQHDHLRLRLAKRTFHSRYCTTGLKTTCLTDCLIRKARQNATCLPFLGVPDERKDVPFCRIDSGYDKIAEKVMPICGRECQQLSATWRPCSEIELNSYTVVKSQQFPTESVGMRVEIEVARGLEVYHTEPKYTVSNILGSAGGILGICFGISIISIMQIIYHCSKICGNIACAV